MNRIEKINKFLDYLVGGGYDVSDLEWAVDEIERLRGALEEIRDYERVVHAGSKSWSIANKALEGEAK